MPFPRPASTRSRSEASSGQSASHGSIRRPSPYPQVPGCCGHPHPSAEDTEASITAACARELSFAVLQQALLYTGHQDRRSSCRALGGHGRRSAVLRPFVNTLTMLLCEESARFLTGPSWRTDTPRGVRISSWGGLKGPAGRAKKLRPVRSSVGLSGRC
jgi:hypothetical protein